MSKQLGAFDKDRILIITVIIIVYYQLSPSSLFVRDGVNSLSALLFMKNTSPNERRAMINPAARVTPFNR